MPYTQKEYLKRIKFCLTGTLGVLVAVLLVTTPVITQAGRSEKPVVVAESMMRELAPIYWYTGTVISHEQAKLAADSPAAGDTIVP